MINRPFATVLLTIATLLPAARVQTPATFGLNLLRVMEAAAAR